MQEDEKADPQVEPQDLSSSSYPCLPEGADPSEWKKYCNQWADPPPENEPNRNREAEAVLVTGRRLTRIRKSLRNQKQDTIVIDNVVNNLEEAKKIKDFAGVVLEDIKNDPIAFSQEIVKKFVSDQKFASALKQAFHEAGIAWIAMPSSNKVYDARPSNTVLSDSDPKRWKNRPEDKTTNPISFIKDNYGEKVNHKWQHAGLTRPGLNQVDPELYAAYAKWISRYPDDALEFAPGGRKRGRPRIVDRAEAMDRRRDSERESKARARANRALAIKGPS